MSESAASGIVWAAAPAALTALTVVGAVEAGRPPPAAVGLGAVVLAVSGVLARRRVTGFPLVAGLVIPAVGVVVACYGDSRNVGWFGVCVIVGWVALAAPPATAVSVGAVFATVFAFQLATVGPQPGWVSWTAGTTFTVGACVFAHRQRILVGQLRAAQDELSHRARIDERHRIAREMHDLVGHSLTVTLLHLGSARLALDDEFDSARASLTEAEHAARSSLDDVRAAVGLMRRTGDVQIAQPAPTAADIAGLVESYRRAGARIDLDVRGDLDALTPNRGLAAFRIVQESLTNAVRHGDGSPISVGIVLLGGHGRITVRNGSPAARPRRTTGTGIAAMCERAGAFGGEVSAGPDQGDWLVEAVIPA